jgi:AcrR family transcriptional regulator
MLATELKTDRRSKRTLGLLHRAMVELLTEKEFHKITVQDITERAEVNRATFYDHFTDKYALLNYCVQQDFQGRLAGKLSAVPMLTRDNLYQLTLVTCDYLRGFIGHCAPSTREDEQMAMLRQVQVSLYDVILAWVQAAPSRSNSISAETIATVTSSAIFGSVMQWVMAGRKQSPEQLTEGVLSLLTSGLGAYLAEGV